MEENKERLLSFIDYAGHMREAESENSFKSFQNYIPSDDLEYGTMVPIPNFEQNLHSDLLESDSYKRHEGGILAVKSVTDSVLHCSEHKQESLSEFLSFDERHIDY